MAEPAPDTRMTVRDFLTFEGEGDGWGKGDGWGDTRYELIDGHPKAMAPPARPRGALVARLAGWLEARLPRACSAVAEAGIILPDRDDVFYVADLAVTCAPPADTPWVDDPELIAEVTSPSSAGTDPGKVLEYLEIPSVREVLLIDSTVRRVRRWTRAGDGRVVIDDYIAEASIPLACVDEPLPLADLYLKTGL